MLAVESPGRDQDEAADRGAGNGARIQHRNGVKGKCLWFGVSMCVNALGAPKLPRAPVKFQRRRLVRLVESIGANGGEHVQRRHRTSGGCLMRPSSTAG